MILPGCTGLVDSDAARLCRSLLPLLDHAATRIDITATRTTSLAAAAGEWVRITYRPTGGPTRRAELRHISCLFATRSQTATSATPDLTAALTAVILDGQTLGPLRLHLMKQNWIARGAAHLADPAPYASLGIVPEIPRGLAIGVQNSLSALPIVSIYAVLAVAYTLIYGLTGRINLAFGELTILAGYGATLAFTIIDGAEGLGGASVGLGVLAALALGLFTGLTQGAALGRWVLAPLVGRPGQHVLIATIGLALVWSELLRLTQGSATRWMGPLFNRPLALVRNADFVVTMTPMALVLPLIAGAAGVALLLVMARTRFGRRWRAFADDPVAAQLLGVDPDQLILTTMLLASGCAALAGVLTTFYYGGVGFAGGTLVGLKALIAAVIGGLGSIPGALLGGVLLGTAEAAWSSLFHIETRDPAIFTLLVVLLALRPQGLLGVGDDGAGRRGGG